MYFKQNIIRKAAITWVFTFSRHMAEVIKKILFSTKFRYSIPSSREITGNPSTTFSTLWISDIGLNAHVSHIAFDMIFDCVSVQLVDVIANHDHRWKSGFIDYNIFRIDVTLFSRNI